MTFYRVSKNPRPLQAAHGASVGLKGHMDGQLLVLLAQEAAVAFVSPRVRSPPRYVLFTG